ncbi:MAG: hypothetical protein QM811_10450 [Pirellulales bacterium]
MGDVVGDALLAFIQGGADRLPSERGQDPGEDQEHDQGKDR